MLDDEDKRNDLTAAGMLRAIRFRVERTLQRGEQLEQDFQQHLLSAKLSLTERLKLERTAHALIIDELHIADVYGELDAKYQLAAQEARQRNQGPEYWLDQMYENYVSKCLRYKMPLGEPMRTRLKEKQAYIAEALAQDEQNQNRK